MRNTRASAAPRGDVAIVGMACLYPQALSLRELWENVVAGVDAVTEMPPERVPPAFYDPSANANDRTYCRRGGFLGARVPFDPLQFGIMPVITECGDPEQLLALKVAHEALRDAGYDPEQMEGERVEVIIGRGNYANRALSTAQHHVSILNDVLEVLKAARPDITNAELAEVRQELLAGLPRFGPDNAASLVPNFTTGRIANRFDLMGTNFTVDAACASSLVALELGTHHLLSGKCDAALVGGAFIVSDLTHIAVLTQIGALSRRSEIRPFDAAADGTIIGEGVGILVLKRLEDAREDGDRIYAVVKGVGTSSDGRALGLLAPRVEGEELALRRAYEMAGIDPATVGLIEAHGTGTPTGDATEIQALTRVFGTRDPDQGDETLAPGCAIGTIKSMIGHALPAAGAAGLIKTALALYHKILPPTLHCEQPNPKLGLEKTRFYINTTARPWIHGGQEHPRRAGVSAFGFGGSNAHVILEEYRDAEEQHPGLLTRWPTELCLLGAADRVGLLDRARELAGRLAASPAVELKDLAYTLNSSLDAGGERLAIVAESLDDLRRKLERACARLADVNCSQIKDVRGIYYFAEPLARSGKLALLFPGEGSQYVGMLGDLCSHFPVVRRVFDRADNIDAMADVFPPPGRDERERAEQRLWSTVSGAVKAVLTANTALHALFQRLGLRPDAVLGHSSGDFTAGLAAGIFDDDEAMLQRLSRLWHAYDDPQENGAEAGLLAVGAAADTALSRLGDLAPDLAVAMDNCPHQMVLAGPREVVERARERLLAANILAECLAFHRAYHTPAFYPHLGPMREALDSTPIRPPALPLYSCTTADVYPSDVQEIRRLMVEHWCRPVRFQETVRKMYADGVRLFLELGARGNLTAFVEDVLRGERHLALCADSMRQHGLTQLNHVIALLCAHGVPLQLDELYVRRSPQRVDLGEHLQDEPRPDPRKMLTLTPIQLRLVRPSGAARSTGVPARFEADGLPASGRGSAARSRMEAGRPATTGPGAGHQALDTAAEARPTGQPLPVDTSNGVGLTARQQTALVEPGPPPASAPFTADVPPLEAAAMVRVGTPLAPSEQVYSVSGEADEPMIAYLQTMEQFLDVQQSVMLAALAAPGLSATGSLLPGAEPTGQGWRGCERATGREDGSCSFAPSPDPPRSARRVPPVAPSPSSGAASAASYPLLDTITVAGEELQAERLLSLETDPFLFDHMFGRKISVDPELRPITTVPTTVSMEIMAEAAAALVPGLRVIGMQRIRSLQWMNVTERPTTLRIAARRVGEQTAEPAGAPAGTPPPGVTRVQVTIWTREAGQDAPDDDESPAADAVVLLAPDYPAAPAPALFPLQNARPCRTAAPQLYEWLFHGPQFHAVHALHQVGDDGITADLTTLPMERFFAGRAAEAMILDPVVLDGVGQLSAAWVRERVADPGIMFPIQIDEVWFYGPRCPGPAVLPCHLRLRQCDFRQVHANMDVIAPDGHVHSRIIGWRHYRIHTPEYRIRMSRDSRTELSGELWDLPTAPLPPDGSYVASLVDGLSEKGSATMDEACAYIVLGRNEREQWRSLRGPRHRRAQWLLGRAAAKDAARAYLRQQYGLELYPADVEVTADGRGRPRVTGAWAQGLPAGGRPIDLPAISLAHTGMFGVAVAGGAGPDDLLGIDIERIRLRDAGFMGLAFSPDERAWLEALDETERWEWVTRFWCAKEAVGKAVGHGLVDGPAGVTVENVDWNTGRLELRLTGALARLVPELSDVPVVAYTARHEDLAVASTVCERVR